MGGITCHLRGVACHLRRIAGLSWRRWLLCWCRRIILWWFCRCLVLMVGRFAVAAAKSAGHGIDAFAYSIGNGSHSRVGSIANPSSQCKRGLCSSARVVDAFCDIRHGRSEAFCKVAQPSLFEDGADPMGLLADVSARESGWRLAWWGLMSLSAGDVGSSEANELPLGDGGNVNVAVVLLRPLWKGAGRCGGQRVDDDDDLNIGRRHIEIGSAEKPPGYRPITSWKD